MRSDRDDTTVCVSGEYERRRITVCEGTSIRKHDMIRTKMEMLEKLDASAAQARSLVKRQCHAAHGTRGRGAQPAAEACLVEPARRKRQHSSFDPRQTLEHTTANAATNASRHNRVQRLSTQSQIAPEKSDRPDENPGVTKRHSRMLARRCEGPALVAPELGQTRPTAVHGHAQERHLEFHPAVLEHTAPHHLHLARERHRRLLPRTACGRYGPQDLRYEQQILRKRQASETGERLRARRRKGGRHVPRSSGRPRARQTRARRGRLGP